MKIFCMPTGSLVLMIKGRDIMSFYAYMILVGAYVPQEAANNDNGRAAHSVWRNYDDFNEYFW